MPKRLANGLTLLSAAVCLGSAMLVGRSMFAEDVMTLYSARLEAATINGQIVVKEDRYPWAFPDPVLSGMEEAWLGIGWGTCARGKYVILPLWLLPLLTAIPPVRWWRARRREGGRGFAVEGAASVPVAGNPPRG